MINRNEIHSITQPYPLVLKRGLKRPQPGTVAYVAERFVITYRKGPSRRKHAVTVPPGFPTDLASVPRIFRPLISKVTGIEASIIHDWLYDQRVGTRAKADDLLYAMLRLVESRFTAFIMYAAVRIGGQQAWDEGTPWVPEASETSGSISNA